MAVLPIAGRAAKIIKSVPLNPPVILSISLNPDGTPMYGLLLCLMFSLSTNTLLAELLRVVIELVLFKLIILDMFFSIMDNKDNYPVLIHCYHGVGRAEMYSAIYRIEYENMDRDQARTSTRLLTKWSSFDLGTPKGDYLHQYQKRNK
mgnify:CR=1 FL=1